MNGATLLRDFWYVVARSRDLGKQPIARKVCGRDLVVFRDREGARVLDAVCPHRGANLAHGTIVDGNVVCPYHGWRFDGAGRCTRIPAHDRRVPPAFSTANFPVVEQQGLVWTTIGTPASAPPRFAALDDPQLSSFCYELAAPVPFDWWVDNVIDFGHLPFVHRATIGDEHSIIDDFTIERRADRLGFVARATPRPDYSMVGRLLSLQVAVVVTVDLPGSAVFEFDLGRGRRQVAIALATPEGPDRVRTWNFALRNFLRVPLADTIGKWFLRRVLHEDVREGVRSLAPVSLARDRILSTAADEPGLELHRLWRYWRAREAETASSRSG